MGAVEHVCVCVCVNIYEWTLHESITRISVFLVKPSSQIHTVNLYKNVVNNGIGNHPLSTQTRTHMYVMLSRDISERLLWSTKSAWGDVWD